MKALVLSLALAVAGTLAFAQANPADPAAHHPEASSPSASPAAPPPGSTVPAKRFDQQMQQMQQMQSMHERMQAAKTPPERAALMDEQMKLMQSGMDMMEQICPGSGMGMGMMGAQGMAMPGGGSMGMPGNSGAAPTPPADSQQQPNASAGMSGMNGMMGMMGMHAQMEQRMAMMQMMMDREAGAPKR